MENKKPVIETDIKEEIPGREPVNMTPPSPKAFPRPTKKKPGRPKTRGPASPATASTPMSVSTATQPGLQAFAQTLTSDEAAIAARIIGQDDTWRTVTAADMEDFSLMNDPMPLPPPAVQMEKEKRFKFRWIARTPARIDEMTRGKQPPMRWWLANSTNTPFLGAFVDPTTGGIHSLDQILVFKTWDMHAREQRANDEFAQMKDDGGNINKRHGANGVEGTMFLAGSPYKIGSRDDVQYDEDAKDIITDGMEGSVVNEL